MENGLDFENKLDYLEDFGFSDSDNEIATEDDRVEELKGLFLPLLFNLAKDPDKDYIYWPNRKEKIEEIIKIVQEI